jgi:putative tricarboxylic transport membrane protein
VARQPITAPVACRADDEPEQSTRIGPTVAAEDRLLPVTRSRPLQWKAGNLRPLCIFDGKRSAYTAKVTASMAWSDIPTCKEAGVNLEYQMLRGIFMPPGVSADQVAFYVDLFAKVAGTPDWREFMTQSAFNQTVMNGPKFRKWLEGADKLHLDLMKDAGFLAK